MEEGFFGFFVVDMTANTANGVNFSVRGPILAQKTRIFEAGEWIARLTDLQFSV